MESISVNESKTEDQASAASASMDELNSLVSDLSQKARSLPGRTAEAHRSAMHDVFDNLTRLLPALAGPDAGGGFRQQLRSVEAARDRLAPDAGDVNAEPAIGTGVRAAAAAFGDVAHDDDTLATPEIAENLKTLQRTVDELDTVGGVGRPYIAADSVQLMAQIAHQMADKIGGTGTAASTPDAAAAPAAASAAEPKPAEPAAPIEPKPAEQKAEGEKPSETTATIPAPAEPKDVERAPGATDPAHEVNK
jgi:hypothetical protein